MKSTTQTDQTAIDRNLAVMPSCLRLPLTAKYFEMTEQRIKPEYYREINGYWISRLVEFSSWEYKDSFKCSPEYDYPMMISNRIEKGLIYFKKFDQNIITLGYPKSSDTEKKLKYKHKGIEIRTGNPEWGAVPDKLYFVIMHGDVIA